MSTQYVKGFTYNGETTTFSGQVAPVSEILSALAQEHPVLNNASNYTTQIQDEILVVSLSTGSKA